MVQIVYSITTIYISTLLVRQRLLSRYLLQAL